ncbi:hypothetical protein EJ04DRAFT_523826 [Polyplosphaeria fusca]|uniref:Uncharacterized protein n=1 Tax=Polyplosphaeria fusca TaxID=682080 RepID=A0A9P4QZF7_9PLEO|nr:hypothetical protein EJ04DRAFT_523826 [Polyplosphaeria fusca]
MKSILSMVTAILTIGLVHADQTPSFVSASTIYSYTATQIPSRVPDVTVVPSLVLDPEPGSASPYYTAYASATPYFEPEKHSSASNLPLGLGLGLGIGLPIVFACGFLLGMLLMKRRRSRVVSGVAVAPVAPAVQEEAIESRRVTMPPTYYAGSVKSFNSFQSEKSFEDVKITGTEKK